MDSSPESPPHPKTEYELLRDRNKARLQKALEPVLIEKEKCEAHFAKKKLKVHRAGKKDRGSGGDAARRRGLRGRGGVETRDRIGGRHHAKGSNKMSSARGSSSEATASNDEAIAKGMMNLAIACTHVQQQSIKEAAGADFHGPTFDSSDDEMELEEGLVDRRTKRSRADITTNSPTRFMHAPPNTQDRAALVGPYSSQQRAPPVVTYATQDGAPPAGAYGPQWSWVPGQWLPRESSSAPPNWSAGPPPPYASVWSEGHAHESQERHLRRKRKDAYDYGSDMRAKSGVKPNKVYVSEVGEVDPGCEGKNAWDASVRDLVTKILDMSVVEWTQQKPHALKKLRDALDKDFDYLGHPLSTLGFRSAITRYLKSERSRLKTKYLQGQEQCPFHVHEDQWDRLIAYWKTPTQQLKAQKMAVARQSVKNYTLVGRKGKVGKEAEFREGRSGSPGITDIADMRRTTIADAGRAIVVAPIESELKSEFASLKQDVSMKITAVMANSNAQAAAIADLKSLFENFMGKYKEVDDGSPSITQSALENLDVGGLNSQDAAGVLPNSRKKFLSIEALLPRSQMMGMRTEKRTKAREDDPRQGVAQLATKSEITLSSDSDVVLVRSGLQDSTPAASNSKVADKTPNSPPVLCNAPLATTLDTDNMHTGPLAEEDSGLQPPLEYKDCSNEVDKDDKEGSAQKANLAQGSNVQKLASDKGGNAKKAVSDKGDIVEKGNSISKSGLEKGATEEKKGSQKGVPDLKSADAKLSSDDIAEKKKKNSNDQAGDEAAINSQEVSNARGDISQKGNPVVVLGSEKGFEEGPAVATTERSDTVPNKGGEDLHSPVASEGSVPKPVATVSEDAPMEKEAAVVIAVEPSQKKSKRPVKSPLKGKTQKRESRSKPPPAPDRKRDGVPKKFDVGDEVFLMNPRSIRQKVAVGTISGVAGEHKFHFKEIPPAWFKVDVQNVLHPGVALMYPNADVEMAVIEDAKGSAAVWDQKYIRHTT